MVDFEVIKVNTESFTNLTSKLKYNDALSDYYKKLHDESGRFDFHYLSKSSSIKSCSKSWDVLWHRLQGFRGIINSNRCRDKFCINCQSALALARESKFSPILLELSKKNSIYHVVFTIKNCSGICLKSTIDRMYKSFPYLLRYLSGKAKIRGYSFDYLGYLGCVKSLEITYNEKMDTYHPHLHCLFVLNMDLDLERRKIFKNTFSYSREHSDVKYFSAEEVLLQKIWFLLCTGQKVNSENIDSVDLGYSVSMNKAKPSDYKEVFKYAFKNNLNAGLGEDECCIGYDQFKLYDEALYKVHFIQGYGKLRQYEFENVELSNEYLDFEAEEFIASLNKVEKPLKIHEEKDEMLSNMESGRYKYYTTGSIKKHLLNERLSELSSVDSLKSD